MRFLFIVHWKAKDGNKQVSNNILFFLHVNSFKLCETETGFTKLISLTTTGTLLDL